MKRYCFTSYPFFPLIGLILSPLAVVHASPSTADSVHFCLPFDYERWQRDHPLPAGKRLADRNSGEPRTVRMIYFLPNDLPFDQEKFDLMKTMIRQVQTFYAEQMQAHGYGNRTFRFETDAQGEPLVHRVDGRHSLRHYWDEDGEEISEIAQTFDLYANVYLINFVTDGKSGKGYASRWTKEGGFAVGTTHGDEVTVSDFSTFIHELGHAFGLGHDFRDDTYLMSYGPDSLRDRLSACHARFLAVHPYFNADNPIKWAQPPTIELTSSLVRRKGETSIPIQIKVRDADGLHQVILFVGGTRHGVKECHGLEGQKEAVVEFDYDGYIPGLKEEGLGFGNFAIQYLRIQAIDVLGNTTSEGFELIDEGFKEPIAELEHGSRVTSVSFSPDGRLLATGGGAVGVANLWDVSTGEHVAEFPHRGSYWSHSLVIFSPDGKLLTTMGTVGVANLWDVSTGEHVAELEYRTNWSFNSVSFSPDGRLLATVGAALGGRVDLWDVSTGEHVAMVLKSEFTYFVVSFSPDGRLLATVGGGGVELWDVSTGERVAELDRTWSFNSVSFSPDGRLLATGGNPWTPVVKLWDVSTGQSIATLAGHGLVAFSPNGRLLASFGLPLIKPDEDGGGSEPSRVIKLWDVSTGQSIATLVGKNVHYVSSLSFSPDGKLLAVGSEAGVVTLWDVADQTRSSGRVISGVEPTVPHSLTKVSGDNQQGLVGTALAKPFVVSVLDQNGSAFAGAVVHFSVAAGGGTLSSITATTDANGRARSTLTLGPNPGTNTVTATVEGLEPGTFTATGQATTNSDSEEGDSEEQQESEETPTATVEFEGISSSHDSVRENDEQATVITLTVTLDKAAAADETITLAIVSPTQGKTAKRDEDFDAALDETLTIAKGQRTGTAQLTLMPKDNTTADGDKAFAVQATSSTGHAALINIKIIDNDAASEPQAWLTPDPAEIQFSADDPAWKTFIVHTNLDSVLVRANPSGSDPAIEVSGGQQVPSRDFCPAEGNDRPTRGRRDGWSLHVKACQAGRTKILLIDYDTGAVLQQYEVNVEGADIPATTALNPSYPNPFNSETVLSYTLPTAADIRLEVFTLNGQRVAVLYEGLQAAGYHTIAMDASALASGVYLYRLTTPEGRFVQKFTLLR